MQVNTKEILLHPPSKGLANCALGAIGAQDIFFSFNKLGVNFL